MASWIDALPDAGVRADAQAAGGALTWSQALKMLTDVAASGTVTQGQFASLQAVAARLNAGLSAPDYVADLFTQLVDGPPGANILPDLQAGTTSAQLTALIGEWFLGDSLPDAAIPDTPTYNYAPASGPLFGPAGAPSVEDICQGQVGDCELMAGLIEAVDNHPALMDSMIVAAGPGAWAVRFYIGGNAVWETVDDRLPAYSYGGLAYAHNPNEANTALWVGLVEKAYAQLSATGLIGHPAIDSYNNISADAAVNVSANLSRAGNVAYHNATDADFLTDKPFYIDAVLDHEDVVLETPYETDDTYDAHGNIELVGDHAFAVVGYDAATGDFIVRNPWGAEGAGQTWDTQFEVSLQDIVSVQGDLAIDDAAMVSASVRLITGSALIAAGAASPVAGLFRASAVSGAPIVDYALQVMGPGALALNGAVNLASAAQTARGQVVVSAAQLGLVTLNPGAASGKVGLLASASDGVTWSPTADVALEIGSATAALILSGTPVAAGGAATLASLFKSVAGFNWFEVVAPAGSGTINLNGQTNYAAGDADIFELSAAEMALVTYTAPAVAGPQLQATAYAGSGWTDWMNFTVPTGESAAAAIRDAANGQYGSAAYVADTAADIFANLNGLEALAAAGILKAVAASDAVRQYEALGQAAAASDRSLLSILSGSVAVETPGGDYFGGLRSGFLIQDTGGGLVVGQVTGGTAGYAAIGGLGPGWTVRGTGDFTGDGRSDLLLQAANGVLVYGEVTGASLAYSPSLGALGSDWGFWGVGDFTGDGVSDILLHDANGAVALAQMSGGQFAYGAVGALGGDWTFEGTGDFLGDGRAQVLLKNANGALMTGEVQNGALAYAQIGALGAEWRFEAVGDFLGDGRDDFLMQTATGVLAVGEVLGGQAAYTAIGALGPEWSIVGAGNYAGAGPASFLMQDKANGAVVTGTVVSGAAHYALVGALGSNWAFQA